MMGHLLDRGDVIDMLEESVIRRIPVVVELKNGHTFEDRVMEIVKYDGEDYVAFALHEFTPIRRIARCRRALPPVYTYAGKI